MEQENSKSKKSKIVLKSPTQERSRQTVSAILEACSKLLVNEGFYSITTDRIAKEAGVSIGSLYQFFGNKESVVLAVIKKLHEEDKQIAEVGVAKIQQLHPEQRLEAMIDLGFHILRANAELRSKILTVQYYLADTNYMSETIQFFEEMTLRLLPVVNGRNPKAVARVFTNCFVGLMNSMVVENPQFESDHEVIKEVRLLFHRYMNT